MKGDQLHSYELELVEQELGRQNFIQPAGDYDDIISAVIKNADEYFNNAKERILEKINQRILEMCYDLDLHIDPELDKIRNSYDLTIAELQEKLERQEGQMKWYGREMKSAITRTKNQIMNAKRKKNFFLKNTGDITELSTQLRC